MIDLHAHVLPGSSDAKLRLASYGGRPEALVADGILLQVSAPSLPASPSRARHAALARMLDARELAHVIAAPAAILAGKALPPVPGGG
ncbi:MAG: hypothetical protein H0T43_05075 [Solirubrobacterales bacterium]|nr:hypothetical protein [Solirubrobacterales bacterium]